MSKQVAIWIDHKEARLFHIHAGHIDEATITAPLQSLHHKHPKGPEGVKEHPDDAKKFYHDVARSIDDTEEVLIVGPGTAKLEFLRHVHEHDAALEPKIIGMETVDHPTDGQLVAYAKKYFKMSDRAR